MESRGLFDHAVAQARYGASVFWLRPEMLIGESLEDSSPTGKLSGTGPNVV